MDKKKDKDYSHIEVTTVPEHLRKPRSTSLDDALEDLGFVTTEWALDDPIADESTCKPGEDYHYMPDCRCN